jgi:hypothetical protein
MPSFQLTLTGEKTKIKPTHKEKPFIYKAVNTYHFNEIKLSGIKEAKL